MALPQVFVLRHDNHVGTVTGLVWKVGKKGSDRYRIGVAPAVHDEPGAARLPLQNVE